MKDSKQSHTSLAQARARRALFALRGLVGRIAPVARRRAGSPIFRPLEPLESRELMSVATSFDGWTNITASADSRIIYVSSSTGNDANAGLSSSAPLRTIAAAIAKTRNGFADWVRLKRGDVFNESIDWTASGRNANEPTVLTNYGTGARPVVQPPSGMNGISITSGAPMHDIAIIGVEFYARSRDPNVAGFDPSTVPNGINWVAPGSNLLVEDVSVRYFNIDVMVAGVGTGASAMNNFKLRRSVLTDTYGIVGHAEGTYITDVSGITIQENLFDHNGWNSAVVGAEKNVFNHNIYIDNENHSDNNVVTGNIIARASSHGVQLRAGGTFNDNLVIDNPIGVLLGGGDGFSVSSPAGVLAYASNNVVMQSGDIGTGFPRGFGLEALNIRAGIVSNNIIAHDTSALPFGHGIEVSAPTSGLYLTHNVVYDWHSPLLLDAGTQVTQAGNRTGGFGAGNVEGYADPTRTAASYNATLGGAATLEAFLAGARNQSRASWSSAYTAVAANAYIRAGFAVPAAQAAPPVAILTVADVTVSGAATYTFKATFSGVNAINVATLDGNDFRITGPNGFSTLASLVSVDLNSNGTPRSATYSFTAPGGTWGETDNGTYTFALQAGQVTDTAGKAATIIAGGPTTMAASIQVPRVAQVLVRGSDWSSAFLGAIAAAGKGDNGYAIPGGSGAQLLSLPWSNINQVIIRFTKPVTVNANDLVIRGVNTPAYSTLQFTTDVAATGQYEAIWTLTAPIAGDKMLLILSDAVVDGTGAKLDGDWTNPTSTSTPAGGSSSFASGNGVAGGAFQFNFNVAPGDRNQNGGTNVQDVVVIRNALGATVTSTTGYSIFNDVNGNGGINVQDMVIARNYQGWSLPAASPTPPGSPSSLFIAAANAPTSGAPVAASAPSATSSVSLLQAASQPAWPTGSHWTLRPVNEVGALSSGPLDAADLELARRRRAIRLPGVATVTTTTNLVLTDVEVHQAAPASQPG